MDYPKMLYSSAQTFADVEAVKAGLASGAISTPVVQSAKEEAAAIKAGASDDPQSFIAAPAGAV